MPARTDQELREIALRNFNEAEANVLSAERRLEEAKKKHDKMVNDAKAQLGTAKQQYTVSLEEYDKRKNKLCSLLPDRVWLNVADEERDAAE